MTSETPPFDPDNPYQQFPQSAPAGYGPTEGFNTWTRINNPDLFTEEALRNPAIRAFVDAPITVTFAQFKSSYRESESFIHKPHLAMSGKVEGIDGSVAYVSDDDPRTPIGTYVINHQETLAFHITRSIVISDGASAGQIIHKEPGS